MALPFAMFGMWANTKTTSGLESFGYLSFGQIARQVADEG